jgi:hypothetical protein
MIKVLDKPHLDLTNRSSRVHRHLLGAGRGMNALSSGHDNPALAPIESGAEQCTVAEILNAGNNMRLLLGALCFLLSIAASGQALADKRVALVIGNSAYQHTGKLANPRNDAADMAAALKKHGFHVVEGLDLDKVAFDRKVRDFAGQLQNAAVGVLFYAGHGLQVAGQNYLVPTDAELTIATALDFEMVRLDVVHRVMERQASTNVIFLDACRDNPLARNLARAMGTRSAEVGRGLAAVESGVGTLISSRPNPATSRWTVVAAILRSPQRWSRNCRARKTI